MDAPVPAIEVTNNADPLRIGGSDTEQNAFDTVNFVRIGTENAMDMPMAAFPEQIQVIIRYLGVEAIGIVTTVRLAATVDPVQAIITRQRFRCAFPLEQIRFTEALKLWSVFSQTYFTAMGPEYPYGLLLATGVIPQFLKRVVVASIQDALQGLIDMCHVFYE